MTSPFRHAHRGHYHRSQPSETLRTAYSEGAHDLFSAYPQTCHEGEEPGEVVVRLRKQDILKVRGCPNQQALAAYCVPH